MTKRGPSDLCGLAPAGRLKRRADFLRVGRGRRWHGRALTLQANRQADGRGGDGQGAGEPAGARLPRVGFTLTKKVGCAVVRNRARRRLREALRLMPELPLRPGHDYVVVGRLDAIRLPFADLRRELARAVDGVHAGAIKPAREPAGDRAARRRGRGDAGAAAMGDAAAGGAKDNGGQAVGRSDIPSRRGASPPEEPEFKP